MNIDTSPTGPLSFLYSRKAWVAVAVIAACSVLFYLGKIDAEQLTDMLKHIFTVWVGAMAVEKGAKAIGTKTTVENTVVQNKEADK
jgi:hypothetical protein